MKELYDSTIPIQFIRFFNNANSIQYLQLMKKKIFLLHNIHNQK